MAIAKEQLREIIKENGIDNVNDIYSFFKESFKDMLQEMLEAEMDVSLGYPKNDKGVYLSTEKWSKY
nr:hypothetical protein [Alkalibaculum sporogenes]